MVTIAHKSRDDHARWAQPCFLSSFSILIGEIEAKRNLSHCFYFVSPGALAPGSDLFSSLGPRRRSVCTWPLLCLTDLGPSET